MEDEGFLHAILENPADDTVRLVYADWLEEHDDPRSEFIRVQCALAKLPGSDARRPELKIRGQELYAQYGQEWDRPLRCLVQDVFYRRGFVERVTVDPQVYAVHSATLFQLAPIRDVLVDLVRVTIPLAILELIPESVARENIVLPLAQARGSRYGPLVVALSDPTDVPLIQKLAFILNKVVLPMRANKAQIIEAINRYYGPTETDYVETPLFTSLPVDEDAFDFSEDEIARSESPNARLVNLIIQEAIHLRATAIHIDRHSNRGRVRYRIEGELVERDSPPARLIAPVIARVKRLAGIAPEEQQQVQRGRIRRGRGVPCDLHFRVFTTAHGPSLVMRIRGR
jgi:type IV pilus assembly protein PilB